MAKLACAVHLGARVRFIVSIKAFGDFVIACHSLRRAHRRVPDGNDLKILAGEHLSELARALDVERYVWLLPSGPACPPAFDIRKEGAVRGAKSLLALRALFQLLPRDCELFFDQVRLRESIISAPLSRVGLTPAANIYMAYEKTLGAAGFDFSSAELVRRRAGAEGFSVRKRVAVFPSSRIASKCLPASTISHVVEQIVDSGFAYDVIDVGDGSMDVAADLRVRRIERTFQSLISTIVSCDLVVSADSLPAHIAEYYGVPSYVVSPRPNQYWLPLSSFRAGAWCLFDQRNTLRPWLELTSTPTTPADTRYGDVSP